jgi:hypothetical protein
VKNLHRNLSTRLMNAVCDNAVIGDVLVRGHHRGAGQDGSFKVGTYTACDHQSDTAPGPLGIKLGHAVPITGFL